MHMKIAYITDSGSGKSIEEFAKDGIISVPLQITDGTLTYQDMETLGKNDVVKLLEQKKVLSTSQPSPGLIEECFTSLKEQGTDLVIAVPICNGLSGTGSTMSALARSIDLPIIVVDTYSANVIEDYLVHAIKNAYDHGASDMDVRLLTERVIDSCETIVIPQDLKHLARSGRLTNSAARLANLLRITPILHLNKETGGRIDTYDKVISFRKAMKRVIEHMKEKPIDETWSITIAHTNAIEDAELFYHAIAEAFPTADIQITQVCNVVSAQAGLGCVCLQYFQKV